MLKRATLVAMAGVVLASGCSGSGTQQDTSPGGIWAGDLQNLIPSLASLFPNDQFNGVIAENGDGFLLDAGNLLNQNLAIYRLSAQSLQGGTQFGASYTAFALSGQTFPNGNAIDIGTLTGSFNPQNFISGTSTLAGATPPTPQQFILNFNSQYLTPYSLASIAGSYTATISATTGSDSGTLVVNTDGTFSLVNTAGCTISGTLTSPNSSFDAFEQTGSFACSGSTTISFTGFAYYVPANTTIVDQTPTTLNLEYDDGATTAGYISGTLPLPTTTSQ